MTIAQEDEHRATNLGAGLAAFLSRELGRPVVVKNVTPLSGGASREMWSFDASLDGEVMPLVLRRDPPGVPNLVQVQSTRAAEFRVLQAVAKAGVPAPRAHWLVDNDSFIGGPGLIMERLTGETIPRRVLRDPGYARARKRLVRQCAEILGRIHSIDPHDLDLVMKGDVHPAVPQIAEYERYLDELGDPHPGFEIGLRWLRGHVPQQWRTTLVHGDFRLGNLMVDGEGIVAVLDWEVAHAGDPMEDLGWFCVRSWRYGNDDKPVGGLGGRDELYAAYQSASGCEVDRQVAHFWEVLGTLKWGVQTIMQTYLHLRGRMHSLELLAVGRRTCEMEWDVLELIG